MYAIEDDIMVILAQIPLVSHTHTHKYSTHTKIFDGFVYSILDYAPISSNFIKNSKLHALTKSPFSKLNICQRLSFTAYLNLNRCGNQNTLFQKRITLIRILMRLSTALVITEGIIISSTIKPNC